MLFSVGYSCLVVASILLLSLGLVGCINSVVTINFLSFSGIYWWLNVDFDISTLLILLMLFICFIYVKDYTNHYFSNGLSGVELGSIIRLFVAIMALLVVTGDFLSTLILWEYLGAVSFFLILFYSNYLSLRSSVVTLVSSRFGDVCLFILICSSQFIINASWFVVTLMIFFIVFTKSASFPFISWLLEAMRAPTPVSSLVHSSTLVAAGVWFFMRYDFLLFFSNCAINTILLLTIIITGVSCFFFIDLKKIVALSTCNNIAWCTLYLIFGDFLLSLFQLISHGVSKCMLFMLIGDVMSGSGGAQASNIVYASRLYSNVGVFSLFSVILGLSGAPFIGVFYTKHFLLSNFMGINNISLGLIVYLCIFLSYFYSFRLCSIIMNVNSSNVVGVLYSFNCSLMAYFWLFINYYVSFTLDEVIEVNQLTGLALLLFQVVSCYTAYFFYNNCVFRRWSSSLFGCDSLVEEFYSLFNNLTQVVMLFLYRWDSYIISVFCGLGSGRLVGIYSHNLLNLVVFFILIFLMCFCIIY